jgi:hypothetical protein
LEDAVTATVQAYVAAVRQLVQEQGLRVWVHPVPPVLPETRHVVLLFNQALKQQLQEARRSGGTDWGPRKQQAVSTEAEAAGGECHWQGQVHFVDLAGELLEQDGCLDFDGTHLHPKYLAHLQAAMECNSDA